MQVSVRGHRPPLIKNVKRYVGWQIALKKVCAPYSGEISGSDKGYTIKLKFYVLRPWGHMCREGVKASAPKHPVTAMYLMDAVTVTVEEVMYVLGVDKKWCLGVEATKQWVGDPDLQGIDITVELV